MCELCDEADVFHAALQSAMTVLDNRADERKSMPNVVRISSYLSDQLRAIVLQESFIYSALDKIAEDSMLENRMTLQAVSEKETLHALALAFMAGVEFGRTGREICTWDVDQEGEDV